MIKIFLNGKYYFDDRGYFAKMGCIDEQVKSHRKKCTFLIWSDEQMSIDHFDGLSVSYDKRRFMIDLYSLASCNYIAAPPSTFSKGASFSSKASLFLIFKEGEEITLDKFKVAIGVKTTD